MPREVEVSAADGCKQSLGGVKTPGALVEASESVVPRVSVPVCAVNGVSAVPGVSVPVCVVESVSVPVCAVTSGVPVCVVSRCVFTSVLKCVLRRTHTGSKRRCVRETLLRRGSGPQTRPIERPGQGRVEVFSALPHSNPTAVSLQRSTL